MSGFTAQQLQTLRDAIAAGVLEIQYADGKRVKYASIAEMMRAKALMENEIAAATTSYRKVTRTTATFSRGL